MAGTLHLWRIASLAASSAAVLFLGMARGVVAVDGADANGSSAGRAAARTAARDAPKGVVTVRSAAVVGQTLTITFSGDLRSTMVDVNEFVVLDGNNTDAVDTGVINGNTLTLTLNSAVASGDSVTVSYKPAGFYDLTDTNGKKVVAFAENLGPPRPAVPTEFTVSGRTMTIVFSRPLRASLAVEPSVFAVVSGNAQDPVAGGKVRGAVLTLLLKRPVSPGNNVTISYHPTTSNHLTSYLGIAVSGFSHRAVMNITKSSAVPNGANSANAAYNGTWRAVGKSPYLTGSGKHYADYSDAVRALTTEGGVLYAGTRDGVYAFKAGAWRLIGSSRYLNTGSLIPFDNTLFATFAGKGVAYYAKGKWYQAGASQNMNAGALVVLGNRLYSGTDKGIYVLEHSGAWGSVGASAKLTWAGMLANINGQLYTAASQNDVGRVFVYHEGSWQTVGQLGSYLSPVDVHALLRYHNVLYAATDIGVFAHAAGSWNLATQGSWKDSGLDQWDVRTLIIVHGTLFAATIHGVYAYVHGSWQQVGASFYEKTAYGAAADVAALATLHGVLYAGTAYGVYAYGSAAQR